MNVDAGDAGLLAMPYEAYDPTLRYGGTIGGPSREAVNVTVLSGAEGWFEVNATTGQLFVATKLENSGVSALGPTSNGRFPLTVQVSDGDAPAEASTEG